MNSLFEVPWRIRDALVLFVLPWLVMPFALGLELGAASKSIPAVKHFLASYANGDPKAALVFVGIEVVTALLLLGLYMRRYGFSWQDLGLRKVNLMRLIGYVLAALIALTIVVGVAFAVLKGLFPHFNPDQPQTNEFTSAAPGLRWVSFTALVLIPPVIEEMVFRGFMFPAFAKRYGAIGGAIASSLLFGLAHLQGNVVVYTFVLGLLLCFMYHRLRSIIPGIGLHMLNNYLAYMAIFHK